MPGDLAVPAELVAELEAVAERDRRPVSVVLRDALERYLAERRSVEPCPQRTAAEAVARMLANRVRLPEGVTMEEVLSWGRR